MKKFRQKINGEVDAIRSTKGITLVALVITIIVLIILAGVSINAIMNDGLILNAKATKDEWKKQSDAEQLELIKLEGTLVVENLKEINAGEYTGTENKKYVEGEKTAIIPAGFTVSNIEGEKTISKGLVIYSGKVTDWSTAQTTHNQYVWIPVENPSDIYGDLDSTVSGIQGTKFGKLYNFGTYSNGYATSAKRATHYNWPTEIGYDSKLSYIEPANYSKENIELNLNKEFESMIVSVEKYKGFYIGRYELTGSVSVPTVTKGVTPLANTTWYNFYNACTNLESGNEKAKDKVRTSIIWGCQWDQAVKLSLTDKSDFLNNAGDYGVYGLTYTSDGSNIQVTGTKSAVYNIYDMGGNLDEWIFEACGKNRSSF